jgi:alpha-tubulin suppressor-like RCC1 family protein
VSDVVASSFGASFALDERGQVYRWGTNQIEQSNRPVMDSFNNVINFQYPDVIASQSLPTIIGKKSIN